MRLALQSDRKRGKVLGISGARIDVARFWKAILNPPSDTQLRDPSFLVQGEVRLKGIAKTLIAFSPSARTLFSVAPPVDRLDVVGMIVSPSSSHATRANVIRDDVAIIAELFFADGTTDLPISARMVRIVDATDSSLPPSSILWYRFPATAKLGAVNRAQLISAQSHGFSSLDFGGMNAGFVD